MLQDIRDNAQGIVAKIIIGFIVVSFSLFGVDSLIGGGGPAAVATINGEEITVAQLEQAIYLQKRKMLNSMGEGADPSMLDDSILRGPVLEQLVQRQLLLQAADNLSISIADNLADQAIVNMPEFQEAGKFSPQLYQNILRSSGYTLAYFKQLMFSDMVINQLNNGLSGSDFVTETELAGTARIIGQRRSFRYFMLPLDKVSEQVTVDDEEIEQYYSDQSNEFQTENRVKLEYVEVTQQEFFKPITDDDLKEAYDLEMADFNVNEERRAAHILIEINGQRNEEQAVVLINKLADRIKQGDIFADLAEEFSDDTGSALSAGDLGFTTGDTFPLEFEKALFALELNQVSKPVLTDAGYHLIIATEIKGVEKPSFSDRKPLLLQRLQLAAAEKDFVRVVEELRDRVFNSEGLAGPAKDLNLTVSASDWLSLTTAKGVLANPLVLAAAFSPDVLDDGNNSEVIELAADHFVVVRVIEHDAPHTKALAEVKVSIADKLSLQKTTVLAQQLAEESIIDLETGKSMEKLAQEKDYEWQVALDVTRNSAKVNRELLSAVFNMVRTADQGSFRRQAVTLRSGNVAVVQLEKVLDGTVEGFSAAEQRGIKTELQRNNGAQSLKSFVQTLRDRAEIEIL